MRRDTDRPARPVPRSFLGALVGLALVVSGVLGLTVGSSQEPRGPSLKSPVGLTSVEVGGTSHDDGPAGVVTKSSELPVTSAPTASAPLVTPLRETLERSLPVRLEVPRINLTVGLTRLGLNADGSVEVPSDPARAGWFTNGASPGERGSAVMLGHVDSTSGPGVFFHLDQLGPGDVILVTRSDRVRVEFSVIGVRQYDKDAFPSEDVYGDKPYAALQLVTCGGLFDRDSGHYLSNIVVYSVMTAWQAA